MLVVSYTTVSSLPKFLLAVYFLLHFPSGHPGWMLSTTLLYGARTFLYQKIAIVRSTRLILNSTQHVLDWIIMSQPPKSLWWDSLSKPLKTRESVTSSLNFDVAIIGAGYTGLWSAYYLKQKEPNLNIGVFEGSVACFGSKWQKWRLVFSTISGRTRQIS